MRIAIDSGTSPGVKWFGSCLHYAGIDWMISIKRFQVRPRGFSSPQSYYTSVLNRHRGVFFRSIGTETMRMPSSRLRR